VADVYYCVKCKKKNELKDAQRVTMKNGKPALKGQCVVCVIYDLFHHLDLIALLCYNCLWK